MRFVFQNKYPQEFLDRLAEKLGFKWIKAIPTLVDKDKIEVRPLPPPSGELYYTDFKYGDAHNPKSQEE